MSDLLNLRCGALSTGQKQRTNIARALIADPPILVLDEPTLGLDVLSNRMILEFIRSQADAGKAILLSTHALDEIDTMCRAAGPDPQRPTRRRGQARSSSSRRRRSRLSEVFLHLVGADEPVFTH
jgi:sodium transport system ATP-binding protein